jgi:small subunit ribosomal protein S18
MAEFKERGRSSGGRSPRFGGGAGFGGEGSMGGFGRGPSGYGRENGGQDQQRRIATPQQTQCRFCRRGERYVDYKDIETLQKLLTHRGKIYSRKRSGNCAGCQRKVKTAIKYARFMALLPFTA